MLAIDALRTNGDEPRWEVVVKSGAERTGRDVAEWATRAVELGAGEILLTSFDRDGTHEGYDLDLVSAVRAAVNLPVIASGGASSPDHMVEAVQAGADAVLAASIFHDDQWTVSGIKRAIADRGIEVRQ